MGLYRIRLSQDGIPRIPDTMRGLGYPITRTETDAQGVHYYFAHPKRNIEMSFWVTRSSDGTDSFLMMGLSPISTKIIGSVLI